MKLYHGLAQLSTAFNAGAVAIGNFDGVHLGHALIVEQLCRRAAEMSGPATIFTFSPPPATLLRPEIAPPSLTWLERKAELLGALSVDIVIAYPTDRALLALTPREYFDRIILNAIRPRAIVEGPNFCFGKDRTGSIDVLRQFCTSEGICLDVVEPFEADGDMVSSSRIRQLILQGDMVRANALLSQPYRIQGRVIHGLGRGAQLGIPTANLSKITTIVPAAGVYAGTAWLGAECWRAAISIGPNATFGESEWKVEVHLIDFPGTSLYDRTIEVELLAKLRDMRTFRSIDELVVQIQDDIRATREQVVLRGEKHNSP